MTDAMTKVVMDGDGVAHPKVHALIVAAGKGSRFGGELPKQYLMIGGQTVLAHSMDALAQVTLDSLNVVIAKDDTHAARVMETWCVISDASASCTTSPIYPRRLLIKLLVGLQGRFPQQSPYRSPCISLTSSDHR